MNHKHTSDGNYETVKIQGGEKRYLYTCKLCGNRISRRTPPKRKKVK